MPDYAAMKLGKLAPRIDDRTLRLARYLNPAALPPIPTVRAWDKGIARWGMMDNDRIGCCTCAAAGHQIQTWTVNASSEITISDADVIAAYSAVSGYNPQTGANDNGAVELDVLNYWRKTGIGGHRLGAFADVAAGNHDLIRAAIDLLGGLYIGVQLPLSAQNQMGGLWDVEPGPTAGAGSWGGHAINVIDYDATTYTCVTWSALQRISVPFWNAYVDECHALLAPEWFGPTAQAPSGFDLTALTRDLAIVSGQPVPAWQPDAYLLSWLAWQTAATEYVTSCYTPGDVADAESEQAVIASHAQWLADYIAGKTTERRAVPPLPKVRR